MAILQRKGQGGRESNKMKEKVREGQGVRGNQKRKNERHGGKKRKEPEDVPGLVDDSEDEGDAAALKAQQEYKKALQDKTINI